MTSEHGLSNKRSACVRLDCVGMDSISHRSARTHALEYKTPPTARAVIFIRVVCLRMRTIVCEFIAFQAARTSLIS